MSLNDECGLNAKVKVRNQCNGTQMLKYLLSLACLSLICPMVLACELTVYGSNNKYPKVYLEDGEAKGVLVDMVHYIGEQIQCDMIIKLSPWKRAYKTYARRRWWHNRFIQNL